MSPSARPETDPRRGERARGRAARTSCARGRPRARGETWWRARARGEGRHGRRGCSGNAAALGAIGCAGGQGGVPPIAADLPTVNAPLTGVFYRSPSPQAQPYVQVGSNVAAGEVIGLIEAMKLFNEIRSTAGGKVRRIFIENGQLVRAHQPLIEVEPS